MTHKTIDIKEVYLVEGCALSIIDPDDTLYLARTCPIWANIQGYLLAWRKEQPMKGPKILGLGLALIILSALTGVVVAAPPGQPLRKDKEINL